MTRTTIVTIVIMLLSTSLTGCMTTRNGSKPDNALAAQDIFRKKTVAMLPIKSQASISTDSQTPLKKALIKKINTTVRSILPQATIIDTQTSSETLNDSGKLESLEKLMSSYENTGAFDKKLVNSICSTLKADYFLIPILKVEQMNAVIAKTFVSSLEIIILGKNSSEPAWQGTGDFGRHGAYGLGGTEADEAAEELVSLAFGKQ